MPHLHRDHRLLVAVEEDVVPEFGIVTEQAGYLIAQARGNDGRRIDPVAPPVGCVVPETGHRPLLGKNRDTAADRGRVQAASPGPGQQRGNDPLVGNGIGPPGIVCYITSFGNEVNRQVKNLGLLDFPAYRGGDRTIDIKNCKLDYVLVGGRSSIGMHLEINLGFA